MLPPRCSGVTKLRTLFRSLGRDGIADAPIIARCLRGHLVVSAAPSLPATRPAVAGAARAPGRDALAAGSRLLRRLGTWQIAVVAGYVAALAFAAAHHPYWSDETQAWLIAKDSSLWNMFAHVLRYEGNPGLWHLLLWLPAHLGAPMASLSVITAFIAVAGVVLLVYRSPFPAWARATLPFTYFVFFQYGVVARPYCLIPLATCCIALAWRDRMTHPYRLVAALTLMSFIAVDGLLVAAALAAVHALDVRRAWPGLADSTRRRQLRSGLLLAAVIGLIVAILWPPADSSFNLMETFVPGRAPGRAGRLLAGAFAGVWLTGPVLAASAVFLYRRAQLRVFLLPAIVVMAFFVVKIGEPWQDGFLFFPWLLAMWMAWSPDAAKPADRPRELTILSNRVFGTGALACVIGLQVYWSVAAVVSSTRLAYSALPATAQYLESQKLTGGVVYGYGFYAFSLDADLGKNIYANMNGGGTPTFYPWTTEQLSNEQTSPVRAGVPDVVVISVHQVTRAHQVTVVPLPGYVRVAYFQGALIWEDGVYEHDDLLIARRADFHPSTAYGGTCPTYCGPPTSSSPAGNGYF